MDYIGLVGLDIEWISHLERHQRSQFGRKCWLGYCAGYKPRWIPLFAHTSKIISTITNEITNETQNMVIPLTFVHLSLPLLRLMQYRLWRKTRQPHSYICYGADPNRNFNSSWNTAGTSQSPCSDTYAGPRAFSEPESLAVSKFITKWNPKIYLSLHSYGQYVLYPRGHTRDPIPNHSTVVIFDILVSFDISKWTTLTHVTFLISIYQHEIGVKTAEAFARRYGTEFTVGSPPNILCKCYTKMIKHITYIANVFFMFVTGNLFTSNIFLGFFLQLRNSPLLFCMEWLSFCAIEKNEVSNGLLWRWLLFH